MTIQNQTYGSLTTLPRPTDREMPAEYRDQLNDLFDTWHAVRSRNRILSDYYNMKSSLKNLGISIPENFLNLNCVVGWCAKAVQAQSVRSVFDGYVFNGSENSQLNELVRANKMRTLYQRACKSMLIHGLCAITVMGGGYDQPEVKVRVHSANQCAVLWDKDKEHIACGIVLQNVDRNGCANEYVAHFPFAVITFKRYDTINGYGWTYTQEYNPMGRPLMEVLVNDPDIDRPLGHSLLTPELLGIVDKAMRDVLRMEVGAEFFTFPQRYILGASEDLFSVPPEDAILDDDGNYIDSQGNIVNPVSSEYAKFKAYIGALMAISRDENGELPQVGQFTASGADNFTRVFENDAQRFSGATNVPLAQLGVLSNTYTSSDALGAANDPLILSVETLNRNNGEVLEDIARMMLAIANNKTLDQLDESQRNVQACWKDPSMPTIAARADAWTKLGSADPSIVGTRVYYEGIGLSQATIDRLMTEKEKIKVIETMNQIAQSLTSSPKQEEESEEEPQEENQEESTEE